ncbi:hypothetical protein ACFX13_008455 [Malus domestica]
MTGYLVTEDTTIVDELLSCSFERNVKELDINLRLCRLVQRNWHEKKNYYCLSQTTFLDAKSITTLCLEATINTPNLNSGFFKEFGRSKNLDLIVAAFKNVIFPTEFRSTSSCAILPGLNNNLALKFNRRLSPRIQQSIIRSQSTSIFGLWRTSYIPYSQDTTRNLTHGA